MNDKDNKFAPLTTTPAIIFRQSEMQPPQQSVQPMAQSYQQPVQSPSWPYQQLVPPLGAQLYQQSVPTPGPTRDMTWEEKENSKRQHEAYLLREKVDAEIFKHNQKMKIDETHELHKMKAKEDVRIQREMLTETILMTESGEIIKRQEYFLRRPEEYSFVNFRVIGTPIRYFSRKSSNEVLYLVVGLQNQTEQTLYLNLEADNAAYFWSKFRKAGIALKRKRKEKKEMIFDVVGMLGYLAEKVELPEKRGFFVDQDGHLCYADRCSLIWKEVEGYAK